MKLIKMVFKNADGKMIEKEVEERLASTYLSMGWKVKEEKSIVKEEPIEKPFMQLNRKEK